MTWTNEKVAELRELAMQEMSNAELAQHFGCAVQEIHAVRSRYKLTIAQCAAMEERQDVAAPKARDNTFKVTLFSSGSYIDKVCGGGMYQIDVYTVRLSPAALNAWLEAQMYNCRECYNTEEEYEQYTANSGTGNEHRVRGHDASQRTDYHAQYDKVGTDLGVLLCIP